MVHLRPLSTTERPRSGKSGQKSYSIQTDIKMGDHPVIWTNPTKKARNIYFQFGHSASLWQNPSFIRMFENALQWTLINCQSS